MLLKDLKSTRTMTGHRKLFNILISLYLRMCICTTSLITKPSAWNMSFLSIMSLYSLPTLVCLSIAMTVTKDSLQSFFLLLRNRQDCTCCFGLRFRRWCSLVTCIYLKKCSEDNWLLGTHAFSRLQLRDSFRFCWTRPAFVHLSSVYTLYKDDSFRQDLLFVIYKEC